MRTRDFEFSGWDFSWRDDDARVDPVHPGRAAFVASSDEAPPAFVEPEAAPPSAPAVFAYPGVTTANGIPLEQILQDRPDVYAAFFREFHGPGNDPHSAAWMNRVGGATPEAYANYWYETYGKDEYVWTPRSALSAEGEVPHGSGRYTSDGLSIDQLLHDRPDVAEAWARDYFGPNNDPHSSAWMNRVGGTTVEDYANYWYETFGKMGQYGPSVPAAQHAAQVGVTITDEGISLQEILSDRQDVFRAFFRDYYGPNNDQHSSAWLNRVGGETPEAYANYWYKTYGKAAGYVPPSLRPAAAPAAPGSPDPGSSEPPPAGPPVEPPPAPWGVDALGHPMPPPPGWTPDPGPQEPQMDPGAEAPSAPLGVDALGNPILPPPSGDDVGGLFLPST